MLRTRATGIDETKIITDLLSKKDSKRPIEDEEINDMIEKMPGSQNDIKEAVNHILVSGQSSRWPRMT
jgi:23S rRNA maturation-related 3'-5' exoribonuclease YhaM